MTLRKQRRMILAEIGSPNGAPLATLRRELYANAHKYPGITDDDLISAWHYNRRTKFAGTRVPQPLNKMLGG